jgi:hypothetical protein
MWSNFEYGLGRHQLLYLQQEGGRIVNGEEAKPGELPYQVCVL